MSRTNRRRTVAIPAQAGMPEVIVSKRYRGCGPSAASEAEEDAKDESDVADWLARNEERREATLSFFERLKR